MFIDWGVIRTYFEMWCLIGLLFVLKKLHLSIIIRGGYRISESGGFRVTVKY